MRNLPKMTPVVLAELLPAEPPLRHRGSQTDKARKVLSAIGGKSNIQALDACITRLRLSVKDPEIVQTEQFKKLGATRGVMKSGTNFQIIFGVESDLLKEEIKRLMTKTTILAPGQGRVMPLSEVPDKTFSDKL